jgi:hypothetical protein
LSLRHFNHERISTLYSSRNWRLRSKHGVSRWQNSQRAKQNAELGRFRPTLQRDGWPTRLGLLASKLACLLCSLLLNIRNNTLSGKWLGQQANQLSNKSPPSEQRGDSEVACESVNALDVAHKVAHTIGNEVAILRAQKIACT